MIGPIQQRLRLEIRRTAPVFVPSTRAQLDDDDETPALPPIKFLDNEEEQELDANDTDTDNGSSVALDEMDRAVFLDEVYALANE